MPGTKAHELLLKQIAKAQEQAEALSSYHTLDDNGHREHQRSLSEDIARELTFIAEHLNKDADYLLDHGDLIGIGAFDDALRHFNTPPPFPNYLSEACSSEGGDLCIR